MNRHTFMRKVAIFFLRDARGQGLVARTTDPIRDLLDGTVYMLALKGLFGLTISLNALIVIVVAKKVLHQVASYLDERWGFWKAENYYAAYELSLFNQEVMKKLDKLLEVHK